MLCALKVAKDNDRWPVQGIINAPTWVDAMVLAANVAEVYTIPSGAKYVFFSANIDFYARFGAAASVPSTEVSNGGGSELNPTARYVSDGQTTIGFISPYACTVTISVYK